MKVTTRTKVTGIVLLTYLVMLSVFYSVNFMFSHLVTSQKEQRSIPVPQSRHLLTLEANCSPAAVDTFPKPNISIHKPKHVPVFLIIALYTFLALAILTDDFFIPALERIVEVLKIRPDVAGATFMAAGSSAPELGTGILAVFLTKDDIGVGTVVGSAVYNVAFVVAMCGLFASKATKVKKWSLFRDCLFYFVSIVTLLMIMWDRHIFWAEALVLISFYVLYLITMYWNERLENLFGTLPSTMCARCFGFRKNLNMSVKPHPRIVQVETITLSNIETNLENGLNGTQIPEVTTSSPIADDDEEESGVLDFPKGNFKRVLWIISLPILLVFTITVPNCRKAKWKKWFLLSFIASSVWISGLTYLLVWMITIIGHMWKIPDAVMGLTLLAAGASVPDSLASIFVARDGKGSMAVSNAVGSNVFDILICLGLPWFLQTGIIAPGSTIPVYAGGLVYTCVCLLATIVFLIVAMQLNGWELNKKLGVVMLLWYILFMVIAILYQLNIFSNANLPTCESKL